MLNLNQQTIAAYQQKMRAQIKEMKARMQMLEAGAENTSADMRIKYQNILGDWKSRVEEIEARLNRLSESSEDAWEDIRSGIDKAVDELQNSIRTALQSG
jgi:archaellum component FlaC